jgi:integrase
LVRYTGHRESALCHLKASNLLLEPTAIRRALAEMGADEGRVEHMPLGAIRWRSETDKEGIHQILPMSEHAREAVDLYLSQNPRLGEAWLFPSPKDGTKPIRRDLAGKWLLKAEKLLELPKLRGGVWHPYRRLWATERKHLPDADVAAAGGWRDTRALKLSYQQSDLKTVLQVVNAGG